MLSKPVTIYGIHEVTPYNQKTGLPYGVLRVLGGSTMALSGELVKLTGGSASYPWDAQDGAITAEMSLKPKEIPSWIFNLFLGATPTDAEDSAGSVSALVNVQGITAFKADIGIASVSIEVGEEANQKFGAYVIKVVTPTTVDVYGVSDIDFNRGSDLEFQNDALKITATPLTIAMGAAVQIPNTGLELTGGSGIIAMVADDTCVFESNPPSSLLTSVRVGALASCVPEFGAFVTAQKQADGSMWIFDLFRVKALGFPFGMEEKAYGEAEITASMLYDSTKDGVFDARYIKPATGCS